MNAQKIKLAVAHHDMFGDDGADASSVAGNDDYFAAACMAEKQRRSPVSTAFALTRRNHAGKP